MSALPPGVPGLLRRLASLLLRGSDARFVLGDLDESYARDVARGSSRQRAARRYLRNAVASAASLAWARLRAGGLGASWLDVKLGVRMLRKRPGLTAVAVFALAAGIPTSMAPFQVIQAFRAALPFDEGERIVGVQSWDTEASRPDAHVLHDFEVWRTELKSFERLGASRSDPYNVVSEDGRAAPVRGAEVTASTFDIVRVQPLLGRRLVAADEVPGAPDVVVLGYDLWRSRFGGDPDIVGRTIRVGRAPHEVVGVMPKGFLFPVSDHLWLPLRERAVDYPRGEGPDLRVFGRLSDGATLAQADAEAATVGRHLAAAFPATNGHLRPEVVRYTALGVDIDTSITGRFLLLQLFALLLLAVACGNVGILILARTASRSAEIAVRTALGASRRRIVTQIFVETLVLALVAVGLGLVAGDVVATRLRNFFLDVPFWLDWGVTPRTVASALVLAAGSAVIAGVVPALKATGRGVQRNLQRAATGSSGIRFGGLSTALIVFEVAISVAFLTMGGAMVRGILGDPYRGLGLEPDRYVTAQLLLPWVPPASGEADAYASEFRTRVAAVQRQLGERLRAEPGVGPVAFAEVLPGERTPGTWVEAEGMGSPAAPGKPWVRMARVDVDFFRSLDRPVLQGRDFARADVAGAPEERTAVIVNTSFVAQVLEGHAAVGRRFRRVGHTAAGDSVVSPWYEIVGVVDRLGMYQADPPHDAGFYVPMAPGEIHPVRIAVQTPGDPYAFVPRLRALAAQVDPEAMIGNPRSLERDVADTRTDARWGTLLTGLIAGIGIALSAAGLYALVSFTVSERTREIGIRVALGALSGRVAAAVGRRALFQLSAGVLAGSVLSLWLVPHMFNGPASMGTPWSRIVAAVAAVTMAVGLLACVPPTLRGLRIRPVDALKEG